MNSHTPPPNLLAVENQLENRSNINEHLSRAEAMIYVASIALEQEFVVVDREMIQNYLYAIHKLISDAKKKNQQGLDILVNRNIPLEENAANSDLENVATHNAVEAKDKNKNKVKFTAREIECLQLLLEGKSIGEIAGLLNLNANTIAFYLFNIVQKLRALLYPKTD